jgi:hypothetical protein
MQVQDLPRAPVPPECDLTTLGWYPCHVKLMLGHRINDPLRTTPEQFRAAMRLMWEAWHQVPAASLPDDNRKLAELAGYRGNVPAWNKMMAGAMCDFVKCADGRWYSITLLPEAIIAWRRKNNLSAEYAEQRQKLNRNRGHKVTPIEQGNLPLMTMLSGGADVNSRKPTEVNTLADVNFRGPTLVNLEPSVNFRKPTEAGSPAETLALTAIPYLSKKTCTYGDGEQLEWVNKVEEAMGKPWTSQPILKWSAFPEIVLAWRQEGFNLVDDVLPVIRSIVQGQKRLPDTPRYLDVAVRRFREAQAAAKARAAGRGSNALGGKTRAEQTLGTWKMRVEVAWRGRRFWLSDWGGRPCDADYAGPRELLTAEDLQERVMAHA